MHLWLQGVVLAVVLLLIKTQRVVVALVDCFIKSPNHLRLVLLTLSQ
jgi:hypothetical protein